MWRFEYKGRVTTFGKEQIAHLNSEKEFKEFFEGKIEPKELDKLWKSMGKKAKEEGGE